MEEKCGHENGTKEIVQSAAVRAHFCPQFTCVHSHACLINTSYCCLCIVCVVQWPSGHKREINKYIFNIDSDAKYNIILKIHFIIDTSQDVQLHIIFKIYVFMWCIVVDSIPQSTYPHVPHVRTLTRRTQRWPARPSCAATERSPCSQGQRPGNHPSFTA